MTGNTDFLKTLKPGDSVILQSYSWRNKSKSVETVQHITPKGFIKVNDILFNPDTGRARGDWECEILEATPAAVDEIEKRAYIQETFHKLKNIKKLTYKQAQAIREVIDIQEAAE